jgi:hypothetical protein
MYFFRPLTVNDSILYYSCSTGYAHSAVRSVHGSHSRVNPSSVRAQLLLFLSVQYEQKLTGWLPSGKKVKIGYGAGDTDADDV